MGESRVVIVGAGIGGLACAIDLAAGGARVSVLERAEGAGGKARSTQLGGQDIASGPTVLTMPWVFDELFDAAGGCFRAEVALERAGILARHAWPDGARLDLHAEQARSAAAIGEAFGAREARAYLAFCADTKRIYETVEVPFLRAQRPTLGSVVKHAGLGVWAFARIDALRTVWSALERRFADPRLRQLFGRYATYCGSSPFEAPATLSLIAHVESEGVFRLQGGMGALPRALEARARALGVELRYGVEVESIVVDSRRAAGVLARGELLPADVVVFSGDVSALGAGVLGAAVTRAAPETPRGGRSLSAVTWTMQARAAGFPLSHHNVFFSGDYAAEFASIFERGSVPEEPTVYVCAQDRGDEAASNSADERLLVLVNAPATGDEAPRWTEAENARCERAMRRTLSLSGLELVATISRRTTPADFHRLYPATGGALYGPIARGAMSAFARQAAWAKIPGLYLCGGSVHPGPGVPMAALSGRLAAARIREDLASTGRSRTAVTSGTTSTA